MQKRTTKLAALLCVAVLSLAGIWQNSSAEEGRSTNATVSLLPKEQKFLLAAAIKICSKNWKENSDTAMKA